MSVSLVETVARTLQREFDKTHLELCQDILGQFPFQDTDRHVAVELGEARRCRLCARLGRPHVVWPEEELRAEIRDLHESGVVDGDGLDTGKADVLGHLDAQAAHADDKDIADGHALHGVVSQDIQLAAVEALIDCVAVRLHGVAGHCGAHDCSGRGEGGNGGKICRWHLRPREPAGDVYCCGPSSAGECCWSARLYSVK